MFIKLNESAISFQKILSTPICSQEKLYIQNMFIDCSVLKLLILGTIFKNIYLNRIANAISNIMLHCAL